MILLSTGVRWMAVGVMMAALGADIHVKPIETWTYRKFDWSNAQWSDTARVPGHYFIDHCKSGQPCVLYDEYSFIPDVDMRCYVNPTLEYGILVGPCLPIPKELQ